LQGSIAPARFFFRESAFFRSLAFRPLKTEQKEVAFRQCLVNLSGAVLYQGAALAAPKMRNKSSGFNPCSMFVVPQPLTFRFTKHCPGPALYPLAKYNCRINARAIAASTSQSLPHARHGSKRLPRSLIATTSHVDPKIKNARHEQDERRGKNLHRRQ
jgi:hypothetical protein